MTAPSAPPGQPDRIAAPYALALRDCVCAALAKSLLGPVCRCEFRHDSQVELDGCNCECELTPGVTGHGAAWVRTVSIGPAGAGGTQNPFATNRGSSAGPCITGWTVTLEIGTSRCIFLTEDGSLPDAGVINSEALSLASDAFAVLSAIVCCPTLSELEPSIGLWQPVGPAGGCAGGAVTISFDVPLAVQTRT